MVLVTCRNLRLSSRCRCTCSSFNLPGGKNSSNLRGGPSRVYLCRPEPIAPVSHWRNCYRHQSQANTHLPYHVHTGEFRGFVLHRERALYRAASHVQQKMSGPAVWALRFRLFEYTSDASLVFLEARTQEPFSRPVTTRTGRAMFRE